MAAAKIKETLDGDLTTTSNTLTEIKRHTLYSNSVNGVQVELMGRNTSNAEGYYAQFSLKASKTTGGAVTVSTPAEFFTPFKDTSMLTALYSVVADGGDIVFKVQGPLSTTVDWYIVATLKVD